MEDTLFRIKSTTQSIALVYHINQSIYHRIALSQEFRNQVVCLPVKPVIY